MANSDSKSLWRSFELAGVLSRVPQGIPNRELSKGEDGCIHQLGARIDDGKRVYG